MTFIPPPSIQSTSVVRVAPQYNTGILILWDNPWWTLNEAVKCFAFWYNIPVELKIDQNRNILTVKKVHKFEKISSLA